MPRKKKEKIIEMSDKIEYLGLDLDKVPEHIRKFEPLEFRVPKLYDEKQYRQYRFVPINDIQILLSPTNRLDDLQDKYKKARPLYEYLDNKNEENCLKHTTFLNMLKNVNVEEIENVEKEQSNLNKEIPFKVKFQGNYLWQIYYSENTDKYFMLVPTEDTNYSTFFFLLKKQLEHRKSGKVFVPISNVQYSSKYLKKSEFTDLENYLWMFTKDWPLIYEVYNKNDELTVQVIGETTVYEKIKTTYKVELKSAIEANTFYKLLKALFILQTELPHYYDFKTNINKHGSLEFYFEGQKIEYEHLAEFIREQYKAGILKTRDIKSKIRKYTNRLEELKQIAATQEIEYLAKEKQISTFLECKKSFFGKVKYFFKYSKKSNKNKNLEKNTEEYDDIQQEEKENENNNSNKKTTKIPIKKVYTLEELITSYKELENLEQNMKNLLMDVNALKLKNKNMEKKIENASKFIEEIDNHKKSIFEFWKYSNKDEMSALPEGEEEEINVIKKIEKTFDYEEDIEDLGKKLDKMQRKNLEKEDTDSIYIATTYLIEILNKIKTNNLLPDELERTLKDLKKEAKEEKALTEKEEFDIFGSIVDDKTKVKKINNKKHREMPKDKFNILEINKNTKAIGLKLALEEVIKNILNSIDKVVIPENLPLYKALSDGQKLNSKHINVFNINPESEIQEAVKNSNKKINLYKINIKEGTNGVAFTNNVFYDNLNKTLPVGMDLSSKLIIDISKLHLKLKDKTSFNIIDFNDYQDDFSDVIIKDVDVLEYDIVTFDEEQK